MKLLIIGHQGFPEGMNKAINFIIGKQKNIEYKELDKETDHNELEVFIENFLSKNKKAILFSDLTGGAPQKIGARLIIKNKNRDQVIVSGTSIATLIEICLMISKLENCENLKKEIEEIVEQTKKFSMVIGVE